MLFDQSLFARDVDPLVGITLVEAMYGKTFRVLFRFGHPAAIDDGFFQVGMCDDDKGFHKVFLRIRFFSN